MTGPDQHLRVTDVDRDPASLPVESRNHIPGLIYAASHDFYDCFGLPRATLLDAIGDQVVRPLTEVSNIRVLWVDEQVAGILTWIPADDLDDSRAISAALLLRRLTPSGRREAAARIAEYRTAVEPLEAEGIYISRQALRPQYRGLGLGRQLLQAVIDEIGDRRLSFHTRSDNQAVLQIYRPEGFKRVSDRDFAWTAWVREPGPRERE